MLSDEDGVASGKTNEEDPEEKKTTLGKKEQQIASDAIEVFGMEVVRS